MIIMNKDNAMTADEMVDFLYERLKQYNEREERQNEYLSSKYKMLDGEKLKEKVLAAREETYDYYITSEEAYDNVLSWIDELMGEYDE